MAAELMLAVVGAADVCIKLANQVFSTYSAYRGAEEAIDKKLVALEALWTKVERQLRFLQKISHLLDEELAQCHLKLLQKLTGTLHQVTAKLEIPGFAASSTRFSDYFRKLKFAFTRNSLDELMAELQTWCERFDPTWYLIMLMSDSVLDATLRESQQAGINRSDQNGDALSNMMALRYTIRDVGNSSDQARQKVSLTLDASALAHGKETPIQFSAAKAVVRGRHNAHLIIEPVNLPTDTILQVKTDVENMARKLQQVDPDSFGILRCYGLLKHRNRETGGLAAIDMVYRAPDTTRLVSLRKLLLDREPVSASAVVRMAKQLVRSVSYIHACDFVHKNIRPDNVLVLPGDASLLGTSYLMGFNQFRNANFQTNLVGDPAWYRNLYRHPQRQGVFVQERYVMQHDIYSLGVCLLEIGLWRSFIWYPKDSDGATPVAAPSFGLSLRDQDFEITSCAIPLKDHLVNLAKRELPPRLGDLYTEVVLVCLTCLDPGNEVFGGELDTKDEDGIVIGVRFIENILARVSEISI